MQRPHWQHHAPPPWRHYPRHDLRQKRRFLFWRFAVSFFILLLLFVVVLAIVISLAFKALQQVNPQPEVLLMVVCGVPLGFAALVALLGGWTFRRIASPVAEVMAAADAVAEGDLTVRVREDIRGEFGRLARSFNHMTAELGRADQQRRNLTADVAHELRNPLHIIQGNLEGILDGVYEPTGEHFAATLEETRLLSRLVEDLQTLSLAEAGQLPLHRVRILVADLLSDAVTSVGGLAAEACVSLQVAIPEEARQLELDADPDRLDQVLSNLITNAIRYTPAGGQIVLSAASLPNGVRLTVQDNGAGIPAEELPYIFDRFWRGDRSRSHQGGSGSGLGLAIARQLIQAHGGKISVESRLGQGTTFKIDLYESR